MDIKLETNGRWTGILAALGIDVGFSGKHTSCPICKGGKDRFRFDNKNGNGSWICNQCGAGDGFALIMKVLDIDFKTTVKEVRKIIGTCDISKAQAEPTISKELLRKIYVESRPSSVGDPVALYLKNRGLKVMSKKLRYHPDCCEPETHTKMPAMLATFTLPDDTAITMHRTFLTQYGNKANILNSKKVLPALQDMAGGAIRLFPPNDGIIGIAEGIETALACYELTQIPTWSAVSGALLAGFVPPKGIKHVMVFSDRDKSFIGQKHAYCLANRLVSRLGISAEVFLPKEYGDFLDELNNL